MSDAATQTLFSPLERIYDWVEISLPGVQHPVVQAAVFSAMEEFCSRSTYWRVPVEWTMAPGVSELDFNYPPLDANTHVRWVIDICGSDWIRLGAQAVLIDNGKDYTTTRSGTATLICVPTRLLATLPDWFDEWSEQIQAGVLARLYAMPAKPYSSPQLAQAYLRQFRVGIQLARIEAKRMVNRKPVVFPYYARGRQGSGWTENVCCGGSTSGDSGGGGGGGPTPDPTLPVLAISPGVITDAPPPGNPVLSISPGVVGDYVPPVGGLTVTPTSMVFSSVASGGSSAPQALTLKNDTNAPITITAISVTGDFEVADTTRGTP